MGFCLSGNTFLRVLNKWLLTLKATIFKNIRYFENLNSIYYHYFSHYLENKLLQKIKVNLLFFSNIIFLFLLLQSTSDIYGNITLIIFTLELYISRIYLQRNANTWE